MLLVSERLNMKTKSTRSVAVDDKWTGLEKSLLVILIIGLFVMSIFGAFGADGQVPVRLSTGSSTSTTDGTVTSPAVSSFTFEPEHRNLRLASTGNTIEVINFFGPARNMAGAEAIHRKLIDDYLSGTLNGGSGYVVVKDGRVPWTALCYAEGNPTGWLVLQQLIVARGNGVSISQVTIGQDSTADVLDDTYAVGSRGYGPAAVGVKSDGTKIEGGLGTQTANTVLFVTQMKMFNMAASHEGQKTVREYLLITEKNLSVTVTATLGGSTAKSTASVVVVMPKLFLRTAWDPSFEQLVEIMILGDSPGFMYDLYQTPNPNGPWIGMGEVSSTGLEIRQGANTFPPYRFFKAIPQQ
jgi:hypothetical protein